MFQILLIIMLSSGETFPLPFNITFESQAECLRFLQTEQLRSAVAGITEAISKSEGYYVKYRYGCVPMEGEGV